MASKAQRSLAGGEIAPSLYARTDIVKYQTSLRTLRNCTVMKHGGARNRPGTEYVVEVKDSTKDVRLIPFIFSDDQTYILEFGDGYMRPHRNGFPVTETAKSITAVTSASPGVVTIASHGYSNGDWIYVTDIVGMTQLNGRFLLVANVTTNTFELQTVDGVNLDTSDYTAYASGGTAEKVYEVATNYAEADLGALNYVQSADVVTLTHTSYPPSELSRTAHTNWSFSDKAFIPGTSFPESVGVSGGAAGSSTYAYKVTAINDDTNEESLPGTRDGGGLTITAATKADPCVITVTTPYIPIGDMYLYIESVAGMTELNGRWFQAEQTGPFEYTLLGIDSTDYTTYTSGGTATGDFAYIQSKTLSTSNPATVTYDLVDGCSYYKIYRADDAVGVWGLLGISGRSGSYEDPGNTVDENETPMIPSTPFDSEDNYPSTVGYFQQRLGFAYTNNDTELVRLSKTGSYANFSRRVPLQDDDTVQFNLAGRKVNSVRHILDLGELVLLTQSGEFVCKGNQDGAITPSQINPRQHSYIGSSTLRPIVIGGNALFVTNQGNVIRDLGYDPQSSRYSGGDLTVFSSHLFEGYTTVDWDYAEAPHPIVWSVRSDGMLLGCTYEPSQEMLSWHRHDFQGGTVKNVAIVPEGDESAIYVVIERTINGRSRKYIERFSSRFFSSVEDVKLMDSHLSYDGWNAAATTMTLSGGSTWDNEETLTCTASVSNFSPTDEGKSIIFKESNGTLVRTTIESYTSATVVSVRPETLIPTALRSTATVTWATGVDEVEGLWHIEGEAVSIFADGNVVASPNNSDYDTITVANGKITLHKNYAKIHIGLPYISDIEPLDIDTHEGMPITASGKNIHEVVLMVEKTRGVFAGSSPPSDDDSDPLENLQELQARSIESPNDPVALKTGVAEIIIRGEWNQNGRVFIRQVDPVPMTILSIMPHGDFIQGGA